MFAGVHHYSAFSALHRRCTCRRALRKNSERKEQKEGKNMEGTLNLVGYGLSAIGPAIATGMIFAAYISGVARQPEARSVLQPIAFLGFALAEALALFGLVLAFIL
jgi:F-type H+-transporting ATPase subunit c